MELFSKELSQEKFMAKETTINEQKRIMYFSKIQQGLIQRIIKWLKFSWANCIKWERVGEKGATGK